MDVDDVVRIERRDPPMQSPPPSPQQIEVSELRASIARIAAETAKLAPRSFLEAQYVSAWTLAPDIKIDDAQQLLLQIRKEWQDVVAAGRAAAVDGAQGRRSSLIEDLQEVLVRKGVIKRDERT